MSSLFIKLNLKSEAEILVLSAPESFESEIATLNGVSVLREADTIEKTTFSIAFVTTLEEVKKIAAIVAEKTQGDAVVWFAYPKASSKKYQCKFNRDNGWDVLGKLGFEGVRQVAIDEDWSALRFRRVEFIKKMSRDKKRAMSEKGKARVTG
ncbi:MAG: hypothetical protein DCF20_03425 [Pseudanabaena sp.]|nr:MAG: hypothetical protein DCF20_03425 [Pseudanabaena sp.]